MVVDGEVVGKIGQGLNRWWPLPPQIHQQKLDWMAQKCFEPLRTFLAARSRPPADLSVQTHSGRNPRYYHAQFTLYGDCRKGRRPAFTAAAPPEQAEALYEQFVAMLQKKWSGDCKPDVFGAMMQGGDS